MSYSNLKLIIFTYIFILFSNCFANGEKTPSVLFIIFNDGVAIDGQSINQLTKFINLGFPDHKIIAAEIHVNRLGLFEKRHRQQLIDKLSLIVRPDQEITHLVISTHGASTTSFLGFEKKNSSTQLGYIGSYDEIEPDQHFKSIFDSIKHQFSRQLTIVLNSCSTMCGTDRQKKNRAQSILNYFNADQGQLYGAYTSEISTYLLEESLNDNSFKWRDLVPSLRAYSFIIPFITAATYLATSFTFSFLNLIFETTPEPTNMALFAAASSVLVTPVLKLKSLVNILKNRKINLGSIFYFDSRGEIKSESINKRLKNLAKIYNIPNTCEFFLSELQYSGVNF